MLFILHYLLLNAGLSSIIVLLTLFLQTYSQASLSEIGALLMVLPFLSILIKPLFCALADRHQAHKHYLMGALFFMAAGYGVLLVAPFFPHWLEHHARLVWYGDVVGIVIGFSAFGVVWSLGDALAVNAAQANGVSWGAYRVWGVVSWGVFGVIIGQINELPWLPKYTPAFLVLVVALSLEIVMLAFWPSADLCMRAPPPLTASVDGAQSVATIEHFAGARQKGDECSNKDDTPTSTWRHTAGATLGSLGQGSARANPRLVSAVANIVMEDLGGTLKSSLRMGGGGGGRRRTGLGALLEQHNLTAATGSGSGDHTASTQMTPVQWAASPKGVEAHHHHQTLDSRKISPEKWSFQQQQQQQHQHISQTTSVVQVRPATLGRPALLRTRALSGMNSLSAASGHVILDHLAEDQAAAAAAGGGAVHTSPEHPNQHPLAQCGAANGHAQLMYMSSLASSASLGRAAAAHAHGLGRDHSVPMSPVALSKGPVECEPTPNGEQQQQQQHQLSDDPKRALEKKSLEALAGLHPAQVSETAALPEVTTKTAATTANSEDLQLVLLKLIVRRDKNIFKYLFLFCLFGILMTIHLSYFFLHLEQLCRAKDYSFSHVMGAILAAHSISETISFTLLVPYYVPLVGRMGALLTCTLVYGLRFGFYGTLYVDASPYTCIPFELAHGIAYGIIYSIITDMALECVNHVDSYLPELVARGIVEPTIDPAHLKLPLRATMQGVYSGAFDGLGNGIGALFAGIFLDSYPFVDLWLICSLVCLAILVLYPLSEWRSSTTSKRQAAKGAQSQSVCSLGSAKSKSVNGAQHH